MSSDTIILSLDNDLDVTLSIDAPPTLSFSPNNAMAFAAAVGTVVGSSMSYEKLKDLPSIEGQTLIGALSLSDINVEYLTNMEIETILSGVEF